MASSEEIRKIYNDYDQDKNGVLSLNEAELAFKALGPHAKGVDFNAHFQRLAKDGVITFEDFKTFANSS